MSVRMIALASAALVLASCNDAPTDTAGQAEPAAEQEAPAPAEAAMNTLTAEEQAEGWQLLFNGQDLTGWRGYKKDAPGAGWAVEDGALTLTVGGAGDLMTNEEFGPFELSLEWKISPNGNSGIIYLIREVDDAAETYNTGPEMQVLDNDGHPDGKIPSHRAGALYDLVTPPPDVTMPVGDWNRVLIRFTGDKIEHWLNGMLVSESSYGDEAWQLKVAASKFKQWPPFGTFPSGHIALQDHGDRVWYRNIKIRPL